mmetsp:Transcript_16217/g.24456  ORF Transcript_16217/g.24456 Transcript_16217/m.24456 type:complete len:274 (-) Transcript_16217:87-908(-)
MICWKKANVRPIAKSLGTSLMRSLNVACLPKSFFISTINSSASLLASSSFTLNSLASNSSGRFAALVLLISCKTTLLASASLFLLKSHLGDSGTRIVATNSPIAGIQPDNNIQRQSFFTPDKTRFTRNASGIPTFMNISLKLVIDPRIRLGESSAQYIGQMTRPIPTPTPVIQRQIRRTSKLMDKPIPIEPPMKINAAKIRPIFLPAQSATSPARNEPTMDVRVIDDARTSTSNPESLKWFFIGTIAPLIIPRSYPKRSEPNAAVMTHRRRKE